MHTFIIAELGSAWRFGKYESMNIISMISDAKDMGADAIKLQWTSNPRKMEQRRNVPEGIYDILAWPKELVESFYEYCEANGVEFMCSVYLPEDVAVLNPYVKRWKVASLENRSFDLISEMCKTRKEIIASTGVGDDGVYGPSGSFTSLHCTSAYPAPLDQLNLRAIKNFDGYSDHSCNVLTGSIAVACGAKIIEVHVRHKNTPKDNPDYKHSLTMKQFSQYVAAIRMTEVMLGDGVKKVEKCEEWALKHKVKA